MFERVRRDILRCFSYESRTGSPGVLEALKILATHHSLKGILVYRFGRWVRFELPIPALRKPLKIAYHVLDDVARMLWGLHIDSTSDIGGGIYIAHPDGVLIGATTMGKDCNIGTNVIIGRRPGQAEGHMLPVIGERVFIGPGSMLFGGITVGDGVSVGPLTVVSRNLPPGCMVVGNPMKIVQKTYDNTQLIYGSRPPPPP
jgi:serine O-acetyltransferase